MPINNLIIYNFKTLLPIFSHKITIFTAYYDILKYFAIMHTKRRDMPHFNKLTEENKQELHNNLTSLVEKFGGVNFFLNFLEDIRATKPHPLISAYKDFKSEFADVYWDKVIFKDKLELLQKLRVSESERDNLLPEPNEKGHKKALNLVKTLRPIVFEIEIEGRDDIEKIEPFVVISDTKTKLNPLFDAIFFLSLDSVKRILNYKPKA